MASISTLTDDFSGSSVGASWIRHDGSVAGNITVSGGTLRIVAGQDGVFRGVDTPVTYDLTGAACVVHVADYATASRTAGSESDIPNLQFDSIGNEAVYWWVGQNTIAPAFVAAGAVTFRGAATIDSSYAWLRIRESAGTISWDHSSDGVSWTNSATETTSGKSGWTLTTTTVGLWVGREASAAAAYTVQIDAVNPSAGSTAPATVAAATSTAAAPTLRASASPTAQAAPATSHAATPVIPANAPTTGAAATSTAAVPTVKFSGAVTPAGAAAVSTAAAPTIGLAGPFSVTVPASVAARSFGAGLDAVLYDDRTIVRYDDGTPVLHSLTGLAVVAPANIHPSGAAATSTAATPTISATVRADAPAQPAAAVSTAAAPGVHPAEVHPTGAAASSHAATPTIQIGASVHAIPTAAAAVSHAATPTVGITQPTVPAGPVEVGYLPPPSVVAPITGREIGCARWVAVVADPTLRPLFRLRILAGQFSLQPSGGGAASVKYKVWCGQPPIVEGWHHLLLYRCDKPNRPLFAGEVTTADSAGSLEAKDLLSILDRRYADDDFVSARAADPTTIIQRVLDTANSQGRVPLVPARYGDVASVAARMSTKFGDALSSVLGDLSRLSVVYAAVGPVLRYGINETAPPGGLLAPSMFQRLKFTTGANVVTQVLVRGTDSEGSYPTEARLTAPTGTLVVDAPEMRTGAACVQLAELHYRSKAGSTVSVSSAQLRRGAPLSVHDLIPGRRFAAVDCSRRLSATVTRTNVTIGAEGAEGAVTVDLERFVPATLRSN